MRFVESRRWNSLVAAVLIGAIGGSLVGFVTTPRQRAQAEPRSPATTVGRQRSAHATATLVPPSSGVRPVAVPRTSRYHQPTTTSTPPTSTVRPKRTTTIATTTTSTTSTTLPSTSSSTTNSTEGPTTSSTTETTAATTETTADTGPPDPGG